MKKELGRFIWIMIVLLLWGVICHFLFGVGKTTPAIKTVEFEPIKCEMVAYKAEDIMNALVTESIDQRQDDTGFTQAEAEMLMRIAMAEAEGVEGKVWVMAVVLNRVKDSRFPNSIEGVIFQKGQFSPISDGRYYKVEPNVECNLALAEIEQNGCEGIDALYFENADHSWQAEMCEYVATVGNHRFYKN